MEIPNWIFLASTASSIQQNICEHAASIEQVTKEGRATKSVTSEQPEINMKKLF